MSSKLLSALPTPVVTLQEAKAYLRVSHDLDDGYLKRALALACQWIEEATGKTLLTKTWAYTRENGSLILPHGPVQEILEVKIRKRVLTPDQYEVVPYHDTFKIESPFQWTKRVFTVIYRAGFGDRGEDVPLALYQAVLSALAYIYENRGEGADQGPPLFGRIQPWIQYHRTYHLG